MESRHRVAHVLIVLLVATAATAAAPVTSSFVTSYDGTRIHVLTAGDADAPALLLVPGWTMSAEIFRPQLERLGASWRVVAMDPRGQGDSDKPADGLYPAGRAGDIRAVVEELELEPVVLLGWSMGVTEVGAYLDRWGTESIRGLVLVDGIFGADWDPAISPRMIAWVGSFQRNREAVTRTAVRTWFRTPQPEPFLETMTTEALKTPTDAALAAFLGTMTADYRPQLEKIDRPTILAVALPSPFAQRYEEMRAAIPGVRYEVFENAGHALFVDQAERFDTMLDGFMTSLTPPPPEP